MVQKNKPPITVEKKPQADEPEVIAVTVPLGMSPGDFKKALKDFPAKQAKWEAAHQSNADRQAADRYAKSILAKRYPREFQELRISRLASLRSAAAPPPQQGKDAT